MTLMVKGISTYMIDFLEAHTWGQILVTFIISMAPVVELRGGIPFGAAFDLAPGQVITAAVAGNLLPTPFIILFIRKIFDFMCKYPKLNRLVEALENKAHAKSDTVLKYQTIGLCILVAVPLPGTGAWTGALVAAMLGLSMRKSMPAIIAGVLIAAMIVSGITYGFIALI